MVRCLGMLGLVTQPIRRPTRQPIGLTLARTAKIVSRAFDDALSAAGGSAPIWLVLISLKTQPTRNQRELAQAVGIQGATLTHHLNAMEADGLITRRRDPANRRVHQVELTEEGESLFLRLAGAAQAHDRRLRTGLDDAELATLETLLGRLEHNVTELPLEPAPADCPP
jgi:MarR family transcriptional regulator for hemolysin